MPSLPRVLFLAVTASALALLVAGTACTRRGGNGAPPVVTPTPITTYYVDPKKGKDTNPGTQASPFKTIKHALTKVIAAGLTIQLASGTYSTASGETFPIVIPSPGVVLSGSNYGHVLGKGTFISGSGEDTTLEKALNATGHTLFATLVVKAGVSVSLDNLYIGTRSPIRTVTYTAVDALGMITASHDTFGAAVRGSAGSIVLPSGSLTCTACYIAGPSVGITAFTLPSASSGPSITLQGPGHSVVGGAIGLRTDGTAKITASTQVFQSTDRAYTDVFALSTPSSAASSTPSTNPSTSPSTGPTGTPYYGGCTVDFGYGATSSQGGNTLAGGRTEIEVTRNSGTVCAFADTWNQHTQHANPSGQYERARIFRPGASGKNVTISTTANGASVFVGPAPAPTTPPTAPPTTSPSGSPSPSPSTSPT